jgi:hypothetical protein
MGVAGVEIACGVMRGTYCRGMKKNLTIRIDPDIEDRLARLSVEEDRSLSELVRRAIRAHYGIRRVRRPDAHRPRQNGGRRG